MGRATNRRGLPPLIKQTKHHVSSPKTNKTAAMMINEEESNESFHLFLTKDSKTEGKQLIMSGMSIFFVNIYIQHVEIVQRKLERHQGRMREHSGRNNSCKTICKTVQQGWCSDSHSRSLDFFKYLLRSNSNRLNVWTTRLVKKTSN